MKGIEKVKKMNTKQRFIKYKEVIDILVTMIELDTNLVELEYNGVISLQEYILIEQGVFPLSP